MIKRLTDKNVDTNEEEIECNDLTRYSVIQFIVSMLNLFIPEDFHWNYDHWVKKLPRDDVYWRSLFQSSAGDKFDIKNLWKLYAEKQNRDNVKQKHSCVQKEVDFTPSIGNPKEGGFDITKFRYIQKCLPTKKGRVHPVIRMPIVVNGEHWDIVQMILIFIMEALVPPNRDVDINQK